MKCMELTKSTGKMLLLRIRGYRINQINQKHFSYKRSHKSKELGNISYVTQGTQ